MNNMMNEILLILVIPLLIYITFTVFYNYFLALAYFFVKDKEIKVDDYINKFCLLIPAHNEELLLGRLLESLKKLIYPKEKYGVVVIADNCTDNTVNISQSNNVKVLERIDHEKKGKGFAIAWALEKIEINSFDAILIIDADNIVDNNLLMELNKQLINGAKVIQCNNGLANPEESCFTRIIHIARVIDNTMVHHAKHKLGLSSFLMGNGMCFTVDIIKRFPWTSFSLSEDYHYYSQLVNNNINIFYSLRSKIFHQESKNLNQASSQRLRWASGKFEVIRKYGLGLFLNGVREKNIVKIDASLPLLLPHPSLLINLSLLTLFLCITIKNIYYSAWIVSLIFLQIIYFLLGLWITKFSVKNIISILYVPVYLIWKAIIDISAIFSFRKNREWKRTSRLL